MRILPQLALFLVPALLAPQLRAEDPIYQIQAQLCLPQGALKEDVGGRIGWDLGANALCPLQAGTMLRPHADLTFYPMFKLLGFQSGGTGLNLGTDYLQYLKGDMSTVFLFGGAGFVIWFPEGASETTKLSLDIGAGIKVDDQWNYELKYSEFSMNSLGRARTLSIGVNFRF